MSRSAADATRFTATGPYASSKPASSPASRLPYNLPNFMSSQKSQPQNAKTHPPNQNQGPGGRPETPKQKVDRLRAEMRAARMAQSSSRVDRMIEVGRTVANKAHKTMVYALIATSGICGALTVYSVISLALYNRRQRALWLDSELEKLQAARLAYANDSATPEQIEILRNEKIGEIYKQKKAEEREQRPWNRAKNYLFSGLKADEREGGPSTASEGRSVLEAVNAKTAGDSKVLEPSTQTQPQPQQTGGAVNSEAAAGAKEKKSWTSWLTGR